MPEGNTVTPARSASTVPVSILLVDDQHANLLVLEAVLEELGQHLVRASSGTEALELLGKQDFAVILLDVQMHGLDGFETARHIRAQERTRHTPIIFLTAYESPDFPVARAYALGAVDYLVKPIVPDILRAKVAVFVELYRLREAERQARRDHLAVELACARVFAESAGVEEASARLLRAVGEGLGWERGEFWETTTADGTLRRTASWQSPTSHHTAPGSGRPESPQPSEGLPGQVWAKSEPVLVRDLRADGGIPGITDNSQGEFRSAVSVPVRVTSEPLGVLVFRSREVRELDADALQLLSAIGSQFGQFARRKYAELELRRSQQEMRDFVENATVGLHWVGADGTILWANRAELDLLGYSREEYVGRNIAEFHADLPVIADILTRLTNKEELHSYEARLRCKDGSIRHVLISSNVLWEDGRFCHTRCFTRDISDRKRLEEDLHRRADELAEAGRRKDEFLAMLAHELRNPLAPVLNGLQIMKVPAIDPQVVERARGMIERQVFHLTRLVDDLLDVSRIARGIVQVRRQRLDLADLVRAAAEDHRPLIEKANLHLALELPAADVWVDGDPARLTQVMHNLLDNAVKFRNGGDRVTVRLTVEESRRRAVVEVQDEGIGISPDLFPRLFDPFSQGDTSLDRSRGGLGLGLSLVKGLVELHGGEVRASSGGPGEGASFIVELPIKNETVAIAPLSDEPLARTADPVRILIVEDNRDAADSLRILLELLGHQVAVAYSGTEGIERAREWRPEVVLCDIGLPGLDGYGVAGVLRHDPITSAASLIALTGYGQEEDRRRAHQAGFNHHLIKPVDPRELQRYLHRTG